MKRSSQVRLVLLGGMATVFLPGCGPKQDAGLPPPVPVFSNNSHTNGLGFYHAPFHMWYATPYNHRDKDTGLYFAGGTWHAQPYQSVVNVSTPIASELARHPDYIQRGGFGTSSSHHSFTS